MARPASSRPSLVAQALPVGNRMSASSSQKQASGLPHAAQPASTSRIIPGDEDLLAGLLDMHFKADDRAGVMRRINARFAAPPEHGLRSSARDPSGRNRFRHPRSTMTPADSGKRAARASAGESQPHGQQTDNRILSEPRRAGRQAGQTRAPARADRGEAGPLQARIRCGPTFAPRSSIRYPPSFRASALRTRYLSVSFIEPRSSFHCSATFSRP